MIREHLYDTANNEEVRACDFCGPFIERKLGSCTVYEELSYELRRKTIVWKSTRHCHDSCDCNNFVNGSKLLHNIRLWMEIIAHASN